MYSPIVAHVSTLITLITECLKMFSFVAFMSSVFAHLLFESILLVLVLRSSKLTRLPVLRLMHRRNALLKKPSRSPNTS